MGEAKVIPPGSWVVECVDFEGNLQGPVPFILDKEGLSADLVVDRPLVQSREVPKWGVEPLPGEPHLRVNLPGVGGRRIPVGVAEGVSNFAGALHVFVCSFGDCREDSGDGDLMCPTCMTPTIEHLTEQEPIWAPHEKCLNITAGAAFGATGHLPELRNGVVVCASCKSTREGPIDKRVWAPATVISGDDQVRYECSRCKAVRDDESALVRQRVLGMIAVASLVEDPKQGRIWLGTTGVTEEIITELDDLLGSMWVADVLPDDTDHRVFPGLVASAKVVGLSK